MISKSKFSLIYDFFFGRYRIEGLEKVPSAGGAVLVYYHAPIPLDYVLLVFNIMLKRGRLVRSAIDKYMIWCPGFEMMAAGFGCFAGNRDKATKVLKEGKLLGKCAAYQHVNASSRTVTEA